ncbi:branched-chain amino acid transport system substrate-binding protein [Natronocella acetinitrilica]|uniref:Branched-chain amino acid transport system substrate-binding protein n=1 Tax=Natronocella acetinitrilica TaxID=414046 RepID=A0AAE3G0N6_9GAMM|nr:amino acid ABC transporter substrate-binding protein [Natronocella acetinitrilica]MCP1673570.1 branched-chain amino acid transport system substrate-binding protein [Natronocella acetinitrilica]
MKTSIFNKRQDGHAAGDHPKTVRTLGYMAGLAIAGAAMLAGPLASAQETIRIGAPLALTGGLADEGYKQQQVYRLWAEKVNANGGIEINGQAHQVEILEYDYQSDGPRAGQLAERLITRDRAHLIMAPFGSGHTVITGTVGERYRVPTIACVASSESVFANQNPYLFGTLSPNANMTVTMTDFLMERHPELSRVAVLGRDDVFPKSMAEATVAAAEAAGLEVVYNELYSVGTLDHSSSLTSIRRAEPDWIYITGYTQDLILARRQMSDLNVHAPIVTMVTGPAYEEFIEGLGSLAEDVSSSSWWHHSATYEGTGVWPTTDSFYQDFLEISNGADPDYVHGSCAGALAMLEDVLPRAGSLDGSAIRDALAETDIETFYGSIRFGENGMNEARELPIIQVQDERIVVLYPESIATGELRILSR